jgi:SAM-dependent methyltransferase
MDDFKYADKGAYHWRLAYPKQLRRFDPRRHALYDVPLRLVGAARGRLGIEVGTGDGVLLYKAMRAGAKIVGVDLSRPGLEHARDEIRTRLGRAPSLARGSAYALPFADATFDFALSVEVIEHLEHDDQHLAELRRVLKPGGVLALTTPQRRPDGKIADPYHVREYDPGELRARLERHFGQVEILGMYPRPLDRLYYGATGIGALDKLVRGAFKVAARWVWNPYLALRPLGSRRCENLAARCVVA